VEKQLIIGKVFKSIWQNKCLHDNVKPADETWIRKG